MVACSPESPRRGFIADRSALPRDRNGDFLLARLHLPAPEPLLPLIARARHLFDLDADSETIDRQLARHPRLRATVRAHPGTRVPGSWDPFELTVRAVLGQQVSVRAATTLAGRLVRAFGQKIDAPFEGTSITHIFPAPARLAEAGVADIAEVGLPKARAATVRNLARAVVDGNVVYETRGVAADATAALCSIPGIGPWTAQYVALRSARDPDVIMPGDLGVRRALATGAKLPTERETLARSEAWRPWRSYAIIALWLSES